MNWWTKLRMRLALLIAPRETDPEPDMPACPHCGGPGIPLPVYHDSTHEQFMCDRGHSWTGAQISGRA